MGKKFGWHSGKLKCKEIEVDQSLSLGSLNFGSVELDTILLNGRFTTSTIAGSALNLGSTYTYSELMEMRCTVTSWTGIAGSFKGYYFRAETTSGNASYGIRGMEIFCVPNITSGTTGLNNAQGLYTELALKHGAASWTLGSGDNLPAAIEANISIYAGAGTLTLGNDIAGLIVKIQGANGVADYTKVDGIKILARDADSASRVFGDAIAIQDPEAFASDWTTGLKITAGCTTAIDINATVTRGIRLGTHDWGVGTTGISVTATDPLFQIGGKISGANVAAGMYASSYSQLACKYSQNKGLSMAASWNELYINATDGAVNLTSSAHYYGVWGNVIGFGAGGAITSSDGMITAVHGSLTIPTAFVNAGLIAGCVVDAKISKTMGTEGTTAAYAIYNCKADAPADLTANWVYGFYIPADVVDTGINIGSCTTGINVTGTGTAANSKAMTTAGWTLNNANLTDGIGTIEVDLTLTGTVAGHASALSAWVNMSSVTTGANYICAQTNGLWSASGGILTNGVFIFGMRAQCLLQTNGGASGAKFYPFSVVNNTNVTTALFKCNAGSSDVGTTAVSKTTEGKYVPLYEDDAGVHYVLIYN